MASAHDEPQQDRGVPTGMGVRVADISTVLAVSAAVLYTMLRIAYTRFYEPLGLTPDDLGLDTRNCSHNRRSEPSCCCLSVLPRLRFWSPWLLA